MNKIISFWCSFFPNLLMFAVIIKCLTVFMLWFDATQLLAA